LGVNFGILARKQGLRIYVIHSLGFVKKLVIEKNILKEVAKFRHIF
jgi:hypothetical protein